MSEFDFVKTLAIGTHQNEHWRVVLRNDPDVDNPRDGYTDWTLTSAHRRQTLGDVQVQEKEDMIAHLAKSKLTLDDIVQRPLYFMEHGSVAFSSKDFSDPWDSGQIGVAYITKEAYRTAFGGDPSDAAAQALATKVLDDELDTYNDWLNGETFGFTYETQPMVAGEDPDDDRWDEQDVYWGFIGADPATNGMKDHFLPHVVETLWPTPRPVAPAPRRSRGPGR